MLTKVVKLKEGEYFLNDCVKVSNIDYVEKDDGTVELFGDIEFNSEKIDESTAYQIAEYFVNQAVKTQLS